MQIKKVACIDSSKTEEDLKACKDKFPPQEMDALIKNNYLFIEVV